MSAALAAASQVNGAGIPRDTRPAPRNALFPTTEIRLLVLDDDEQFCQELQATLGTAVEAVSEWKGIPAALAKTTYHVVVVEPFISGYSGAPLVPLVREKQPQADLIVVASCPSIAQAMEAVHARASDYLPKPIDVSTVQKLVTECLRSKGLLRMSEEALRESVGRTIRQRRQSQHLTLHQVAERAGVSLGYCSQIEIGKNSASMETLYRLAHALGVRIGDLFAAVEC